MAEERILIVHRRRAVVDGLVASLQTTSERRYVFEIRSTSVRVVRLIRRFNPHLLILGMAFRQGPAGKEILRMVRRRPEWDAMALLVVTESLDVGDEYTATAYGADACLRYQATSPSAMRRNVRVLLKKAERLRASERRAGKLRVNLELRRAWCGRRRLALTPMQFDILVRMVLRPTEIHGHEELAGASHALEPQEAARLVRVQMCRVRKHLGADRGLIETVRGVGYRLRLSRRELTRLARQRP